MASGGHETTCDYHRALHVLMRHATVILLMNGCQRPKGFARASASALSHTAKELVLTAAYRVLASVHTLLPINRHSDL